MRVPPAVIKLAALLRGLSTSKGARALETIREALQNNSIDAGIGHLARLYSTAYNVKNGIFAHFQRFRELTALAQAHAEGPASRPHPGTRDWCGHKAAIARLGQAFHLMPTDVRAEVKGLIDDFNSGHLSSLEGLLEAASNIEKKGLCKPTKGVRFSNTDTVDSALGAQGRSSGPSHQPPLSPPSKSSYLASATQLYDFLSRVRLGHLMERVSVLGGTFRLVRDPSTGRVPVVPREQYHQISPELMTHFWLLKNVLDPGHSSYYKLVAEFPPRVAPASQTSTGESGPPRSSYGAAPKRESAATAAATEAAAAAPEVEAASEVAADADGRWRFRECGWGFCSAKRGGGIAQGHSLASLVIFE